MPILDIVQRSEKWFAWRKTGITASMIPVILELSPYQTPYELWAELCGFKEPDDLSNNYHVQRGVAQEPEAREAVENEYGKPYMPVCVMADHNERFLASLDGLYSLKGQDKEVLEIKCPCEKIYLEILAQKSMAPTFQMYAAQTQWQMNCAGANVARLYFYLRGKRPISTMIRRNDNFIKQAEQKALWFWNLVQTKTPPPMIPGRDNVVYDTPLSRVDPTWLARVEQLKEKRALLKEMEVKVSAVKADAKEIEQYFTSQIPDGAKSLDRDGVRATKVQRDNNVDYEAILNEMTELLNVEIPQDLIDKHTSNGASYFRVTVDTSEKSQPDSFNQPNPQPEEIKPVQVEQAESSKVESEVIKLREPESFLDDAKQQPTQATQNEELCSIQEADSDSQPIKPVPPSNFFENASKDLYF